MKYKIGNRASSPPYGLNYHNPLRNHFLNIQFQRILNSDQFINLTNRLVHKYKRNLNNCELIKGLSVSLNKAQ